MHIAFDTWALSERFRNNGIHVYAQKLLCAFNDLAHQRGVLIRPFVDDKYGTVQKPVSRQGIRPISTRLLSWQRIWRLGGAAYSAHSNGVDLMFCPTFTTLAAGSVPFVTTIHDVTPIILPSSPPRMTGMQRMFMWGSAKLSRALITDSECSKRDLVKTYGVDDSRVSVVHLGIDREHFNLSKPDPGQVKALLNRLEIKKPYVFHHGTVQPRKNLVRLMEAFQALLRRNRSLEMQLVLCGSFGWRSEQIREFAREHELEDSVIFTGPLPDEELSALLKTSEMAVMPSLYEGFCLPMVEAMACGVPTIASSTSCLPEISGGVLQYFDPLSVREMSFVMESVLTDGRASQELARKGVERAAVFSWEKCAHSTLDVLMAVGA